MIAFSTSQHPSINIACDMIHFLWDPPWSLSSHHSSMSLIVCYHPPHFRAAFALYHSALLWPTYASQESLHMYFILLIIWYRMLDYQHSPIHVLEYIHPSTRPILVNALCIADDPYHLLSTHVYHNKHTNFASSYCILVVYPFTSHAPCWLVSYSFRIQYAQSIIPYIVSVVYSIS